MLQTTLIVSHVLLAVFTIVLILIQHGKGAQAGAAFGAGASGTVFGSRGSTSFLSRTTAILASLFFVTSLSLAYLSGQNRGTPIDSVMDSSPAQGAALEPAGEPPASTDLPALSLPTETLPAPAELPAAEDLPPAPVDDLPQLPDSEPQQ